MQKYIFVALVLISTIAFKGECLFRYYKFFDFFIEFSLAEKALALLAFLHKKCTYTSKGSSTRSFTQLMELGR